MTIIGVWRLCPDEEECDSQLRACRNYPGRTLFVLRVLSCAALSICGLGDWFAANSEQWPTRVCNGSSPSRIPENPPRFVHRWADRCNAGPRSEESLSVYLSFGNSLYKRKYRSISDSCPANGWRQGAVFLHGPKWDNSLRRGRTG